jgi:hypothetical protein
MKLMRVFVFSAVIVLLPLAAVGDRGVKNYNLKFKGDGQFGSYVDVIGQDLVLVFYPAVFIPPDQLPHVPDSLSVSHLGLSEVDWEIRVTATDFYDPSTYMFHSGWFTIIGANGKDSLGGDYSDWALDAASGDYVLDWAFTSGTGRFEGATGTGRTYGNADLATGQAEFEFSGTIAVPK